MHSAPSAVSMNGISKRFPGVVALDGVTIEVRRGEVHAICGENGAGKSTLMKILSGVYQPDDGTLLVAGREVRFAGTQNAEAAGIAIIHQELALVEDLSVAANVFLGREKRGALGLIDDAAITGLSGGNQQKCIISRWLLTNPEILLLDDPTRGIDVGAKAELYALIDRLCREGLGVILTSSELPELLTLADRIIVLAEGRVTGEFARHEATEAGIMEAATAG